MPPVPILGDSAMAQAGLQEPDRLPVPAPAHRMEDLQGNGWVPCEKLEGAQLETEGWSKGYHPSPLIRSRETLRQIKDNKWALTRGRSLLPGVFSASVISWHLQGS